MSIQTILFPTDFSELANHALDEAIDFSLASGAHLVVYHVFHRPSGEVLPGSLAGKESEVEREFKLLKQAHPALDKVNYSFEKKLGLFTPNILEALDEYKVDLIIMATKGARGFGELWGSKTADIVKKVHVPVIVIPGDTTLKEVDKIALAYDYKSQEAPEKLSSLAETAKLLNASVDVVSVNSNGTAEAGEKERIMSQIDHELENVSHQFSYTHHKNIEEGLLTYSKKQNIGLICVIPHSYNFITELFHDSLTQSMIFHSKIPLLVIK